MGPTLSPTILLLALQIGTRLFTFVINQASIRWSDPSLYGAAHIHLELLLSVVLFLSREGIRGASLRRQAKDGDKAAEVTNLSLLPIPLGIALASLALPIFLRSSADLAAQPYFSDVIYIYLASSLLELLAEPIYLHALSPAGGRDISLRVRAEALAAIAKGVVTLLGLVMLDKQAGLLAFGLGQLAYGGTALATFVASYIARIGLGSTLSLYIPRRSTASSSSSDPSSSETSRLALSLTIQSLFKHLLTEADKVAVSRLASLEDQGGYALGTNYASLPLRLLFQPLEESSRFHFSKELGGAETKGREVADEGEVEPRRKSARLQEANATTPTPTTSTTSRGSQSSSYSLLTSLLHLHLYLGLFLLTFLPPLSRPFILLLSGPQWLATSAPRTLAAYAVFLPVLGWSGILEGFLQSTASREQLKRYNGVILASSATFGASLWGLTRGIVSTEEALVFASAAAMAVRAAYGWRHARLDGFFPQLDLKVLSPSWQTLGALAIAAIVARGAAATVAEGDGKVQLAAYTRLVATAVTAGVGCIGVVYACDRRSLTQALRALNPQRGEGKRER